ncbi:MAG: helix-turn-helix domain-containing protein [Corallococcus sp.]|nr:helix-turn-helix domain-containing protein [Corallococcus sp.]
MAKQTTGEFMALLRKASGYTQQEVAEKLNISNRTLSSWETDRTLPDVSILPAVADLYGVTVDELLRGERKNDSAADVRTISEKSLSNIRKRNLCRFNSKANLLTGISLMCNPFIILACLIPLITAQLWIVTISGILGGLAGVGIGVCACLLCYYYNNLKLFEGIVTRDDYTEENKPYLIAAKNKLSRVFGISAATFALSAIAFLIALAFTYPHTYDATVTLIVAIGINVLFMLAELVGCLSARYAIFKMTNDSEARETASKSNKRLARRVALFGCIPVAAVILINIILAIVFPNDCKTLYKSDDLQTFKNHIQTLVINDNGVIPNGEYELDFPSQPQLGTKYDLQNGFYCFYLGQTEHYDTASGSFIRIGNWSVGSDYDRSFYLDLNSCAVNNEFDDDENFIVNARYRSDIRYDTYGNRMFDVVFTENDGTYCIIKDLSDVLIKIAVCTLPIVPLLTAVICGVIYAVKRNKTKYEL